MHASCPHSRTRKFARRPEGGVVLISGTRHSSSSARSAGLSLACVEERKWRVLGSTPLGSLSTRGIFRASFARYAQLWRRRREHIIIVTPATPQNVCAGSRSGLGWLSAAAGDPKYRALPFEIHVLYSVSDPEANTEQIQRQIQCLRQGQAASRRGSGTSTYTW